MEKFSLKNKILIGVTLFSMFFGAGNLIFPPFLGAQAGTHTWSAFLGFAVSAVGLPILGVIAVTKSGGLEHLASRVFFCIYYDPVSGNWSLSCNSQNCKHFLFHGSRALYAGRNFCSDPTASLFSSIFWGSHSCGHAS